MIAVLADFTLRAACQQAKRWRDQGSAVARVAINFSALQFADHTLVEKIAAVLAEEGLPASAIEVEITETASMANPDMTITILEKLKRLGTAIAIDDFGTGYSSLAYLRSFPIDRVKIDRAFVNGLDTNPDDVELVRAVISMSRAMGLETLAEGVETAGQSQILRDLGCDMAQGYLFGRPSLADPETT
jgi:EAL domain-containing protein (putative c-di-GMP-specific phosphodiesterase class I)